MRAIASSSVHLLQVIKTLSSIPSSASCMCAMRARWDAARPTFAASLAVAVMHTTCRATALMAPSRSAAREAWPRSVRYADKSGSGSSGMSLPSGRTSRSIVAGRYAAMCASGLLGHLHVNAARQGGMS